MTFEEALGRHKEMQDFAGMRKIIKEGKKGFFYVDYVHCSLSNPMQLKCYDRSSEEAYITPFFNKETPPSGRNQKQYNQILSLNDRFL